MSELLYTEDHEWVRFEDGVATIGITDFAVDQLGDVVFVDLPEADDELTSGEQFGEIESTKSVSELYSPVSGTVIEVNQAVAEDPSLVNSSPQEDGWLLKAKVDALPDTLLDENAYRASLNS